MADAKAEHVPDDTASDSALMGPPNRRGSPLGRAMTEYSLFAKDLTTPKEKEGESGRHSDHEGAGSPILKLSGGHKRNPSGDKLAKLTRSVLKKNDPPISKELSERAKSAPLVKKFALPASENLINDYSAALLKHILIHGRMYVSQNYICFESKIFGIKTTEVIPFKDVTHITKKSKKLKFAHGLKISTSHQAYYFASFVSRERARTTLLQAWRQIVPRTDQDDDDEDDSDDGTQDYDSDDSTRSKRRARGHDSSLKRSGDCASDHSDDKERRRFSTPILSRVLPNLTKEHSKSTSHLSVSTSDMKPPDMTDSGSTPPSPYATSSAKQLSTSSTITVPTPPESEDEEEGMYDEGDGFLASEDFHPLLTITLPVDVKTFFKLFYSDESTFTPVYRESRGDKDVVINKWSNNPQFGLIRDVSFVSPVKAAIGPSHTRITETQRYHLTKGRLLVHMISNMLDIPYGDSFRVEAKWEATLVTPDSCKLVVNCGVHFMKKTWFKGKIETQTLKETKESMQIWGTMATAEVAKHKASLPSNYHPPASEPSSAAPSPKVSPNQDRTPVLPSPSSASSPTLPIFEPAITAPLAGARKAKSITTEEGGKLSMVSRVFSAISNSFSGQSIPSVIWFLVFGVIFFHMYIRIAHLEGKVSTLEAILQPLLTKNDVINTNP